MDEHGSRIARLRAAFAEASGRFLVRLRAAGDGEAVRVPADGGWSVAQIGWHVAGVTSQFAGLISGEAAGAAPLGPEFQEREWRQIAGAMPARLQAPPGAQPPAGVTRDDAIAAMEASARKLDRALESAAVERCAGFGVRSPILRAEINLYQVAEWATAHIVRHNQQAKRTLGR
jgi:DinB superfamily